MSAPDHHDLAFAGMGSNGCALFVNHPKCEESEPGTVDVWDETLHGERGVLKLPFRDKIAAYETRILGLVNQFDPEHVFSVASVKCRQSKELLEKAAKMCAAHDISKAVKHSRSRFIEDDPAFIKMVTDHPKNYEMLMEDGGIELIAPAMEIVLETGKCNFSLMDLLWEFGSLFHGAKAMASRKLLHMDIKPQNVLAKFEGSKLKRLNLIDFGNMVNMETLLTKETVKDVDYPYFPPEFMRVIMGNATIYKLSGDKKEKQYYFTSYEHLVHRSLQRVRDILNSYRVTDAAATYSQIANVLLFRNDWIATDPVTVGVKLQEQCESEMTAIHDDKFTTAYKINIYGVGATMLESVLEMMYAFFGQQIRDHNEQATAFMLDFATFCVQFIHPIPSMRVTKNVQEKLYTFCNKIYREYGYVANTEVNIETLRRMLAERRSAARAISGTAPAARRVTGNVAARRAAGDTGTRSGVDGAAAARRSTDDDSDDDSDDAYRSPDPQPRGARNPLGLRAPLELRVPMLTAQRRLRAAALKRKQVLGSTLSPYTPTKRVSRGLPE